MAFMALSWLSDGYRGFQQRPRSHEECETSGLPAESFRHPHDSSDDDGEDNGCSSRWQSRPLAVEAVTHVAGGEALSWAPSSRLGFLPWPCCSSPKGSGVAYTLPCVKLGSFSETPLKPRSLNRPEVQHCPTVLVSFANLMQT